MFRLTCPSCHTAFDFDRIPLPGALCAKCGRPFVQPPPPIPVPVQEAGRIIPCPDCGHDVSRQARACPNCGRPIYVPEAVARFIYGLVLLAFGLWLLWKFW